MPGITGIISKWQIDKYKEDLNAMLSCMMHNNFYFSGTFISEQLGVYAGWTCHNGSFSDCMPIWNESHDICLIYTGENFADKSSIEQIRTHGHQFDSDNASYLVHYYEELGLNFFEKLNGWFSGVLIDLRLQKVILFNDRYGLGRIYYHENTDGFYFSSEAKALLKVLPELRQLDFSSLAETFSCGCVLQNRTLFTNIKLLPGGSKWTFSGSNISKKESYFKSEILENQQVLKDKEYYKKLQETFVRILPHYFQGRQSMGMSLTGGLDGRMIMSQANCPQGELPCYTFDSMYRDCTDVKIARQVARLCHQNHETIVVSSQFFSEFPRLAEKAVYISDGTMDVVGSVELFVNMIARQIAPVRLTGNYGSEIVRGGVCFGPNLFNKQLLQPEFALLVDTAATTYNKERQCHKVSFIAFKQVPWHHYSRLAVEQSLMTMRSPYLDNDLVSLMYQAPPDLINSKDPSLHLIAEGNADLAKIPTDRGLLYRPIPFITQFRHQYEEFTFKAEYAYDYGMPQWLTAIDHFFAYLHLEKMFLGKHKFYHFRVWYRDQLADYIKAILLDPRTLTRPYLDGKHLEKIINAHINGHRNYTLDIHRMLTTELMQRQLIEMS